MVQRKKNTIRVIRFLDISSNVINYTNFDAFEREID